MEKWKIGKRRGKKKKSERVLMKCFWRKSQECENRKDEGKNRKMGTKIKLTMTRNA